MRKYLFTVLFILFSVLSFGGAKAQESQRYVRKKVQPNFFIPNGALAQSKPEKILVPRYGTGETTAKHISADDNLIPRKVPVLNQQKASDIVAKDSDSSVNTAEAPLKQNTLPSTPAPSQIDDGTPNYQKMYQDYLRDLDSIAQTGKISDPEVLSDLDAMGSEKRIAIDKKFNENRNVQKEIQSAIKKK